MKTNMGNVDRLIRVLLALVIIVMYVRGVISETYAIAGLVFAGLFIATSFISFCPMYFPFNINTKKKA
ncbi:MAG: DUF2892 domain-containing protein [Bacteroidetes bacterium]|nr:DUF2892 domain-containing protein [Bacteroidota bacterium]